MLFYSLRNISLDTRQNDGNLTDVCLQIFGGWEDQTILNLRKNVWCVQRNMF